MPLFGRRSKEERDAALPNPLGSIPSNASLGTPSFTGITVNEQTALSLTQVYACSRILGDAVSSLPVKAYVQVDNVKRPMQPQPALLTDPFHGYSLNEGLYQLVVSLALRGNAYAVIIRDQNLNASTLVICHPDWVQVKRDGTGSPIYTINNNVIPNTEIVHIRNFMLPGAVLGLSPIDNAARAIGLGLATETFGATFFGRGATMSGVLSSKDGDLADDDAKRLAQQFQANHAGLNSAHMPIVLTGGLTWTPTMVTPENAQFLETRTFQNGEIAKIFGIPPHMLGDVDKTTSWGTGIEAQGRGFVTYTLRSYLSKIEQAVSALLPGGVEVRFDTTELTRGDGAARSAFYHLGLSDGWLCADDVRAMEDMPPLPEGQGQIFRHPVTSTDIEASPVPAAPGVTSTVPDAVPIVGDLDPADIDPSS